MRKLIFILLLFPLTLFGQRAYYFSNDGDDNTGDGTIGNPYATITKANALQPTLSLIGDSLLFARADTFSISALNLLKSGTGSNKFIIGAYGEGDDPIFTSLEAVTFTAYNDSVDFVVVSVQSYPTYILIDGDWQAMGRYPNDYYLIYEGAVTNTKIWDTGLGDSPNWIGANAVIRKNDYTLDRTVITAHSVDTITYTSLGSSEVGKKGLGYFIQNDYKTLDTFGEWFYDGDTLFIYSGTEDISTYTVEVPAFDNLIYGYASNGVDYVTIQDIHFRGSGRDAISLWQYSDYITIQRCQFDFSGMNAINFINQIRYAIIDSNTINKTVKAGMYIESSRNITITNNTIKNAAMLLGASASATQNNGIYHGGTTASINALIQYNDIDSSAYNGIYFTGNNSQVKNNFINNSVLLLNDGGGIYVQGLTPVGRVVEGNIILNSFGNSDAANYSLNWKGDTTRNKYGEGLYLDSGYSGIYDVDVINNTVAYCSSNGMALHDAVSDTVTGNLVYDNGIGIKFQKYAGTVNQYNYMRDNVMVAKSLTQYTLGVGVSGDFVDTDENYFLRPLSDFENLKIYISGSWESKDLAYWQDNYTKDLNSVGSPIPPLPDEDQMIFVYNPTNGDSTFTFAQDLITIDSVEFTGDTVISAYSSAFFMINQDAGETTRPLVYTDSIQIQTRKHLFVFCNVEDDGGAEVTERGILYSTVGLPRIDSSKVVASEIGEGTYMVRMDNMLKLTTYYICAYATNSEGTNYGVVYTVSTPEYNYLVGSDGKLLTDSEGKLIIYDPEVTAEDVTTLFCETYLAIYNEFVEKPVDSIALFQNAMVDSLVSQSYWARMDFLHVQANNTLANAKLNWLDIGTFDLTDPGSTDPSFTAYEGTTGDETEDYLDTGYKLSEDTVNLTRISNTMFLYVRNSTDWTSTTAMGVSVGSRDHLLRLQSGGDQYSILNSAVGTQSAEVASSAGMHFVTRTGHEATESYYNGTSIVSETYASYPLSDFSQNIFIHALDDDGTATSFSPFQIAIDGVMDGVTDEDAAGLTTIFETYMDAIGKGVIE